MNPTRGDASFELGAEQQAAISRLGNLVVRAGAGSGKTEVLARRFVALTTGEISANGPILPARIAAITFTERAALDMRERIAQVLDGKLAQADREETQRLRVIRRSLPLARISTIHAFCARLLRENAIEAGLDPNFRVLDEYEAGALLERICRESITDALRQRDPAAVRMVRARRLEGGGYREDAREIVQRLIIEAQRQGFDMDAVAEHTERSARHTVERACAVREIALDLIGRVDHLLAEQGRAAPSQKDKLLELAGRWPDLRPCIEQLNAETSAADMESLRALCLMLPNAKGRIGASVQAIRELVETDVTAFGLRGSLVLAWGEQQALEPAAQLVNLLQRTGSAFTQRKRAEAVLSFDDLLIRTRDLLRSNPAVARRVRDEISVLLVDEYQDVDPVQDAVVNLLTQPQDSLGSAELFLVGDEKQSIYRFRGADVRIFNQPRPAALAELPLSDNRRSTPNILRFVNAIGRLAMKAEGESLAPYRINWRVEHELRATRTPQRDHLVEIIIGVENGVGAEHQPGEHGRLDSLDRRRLEARAIANLITSMVAAGEMLADDREARKVTWSDIVVLLRAFTDIAVYEEALSNAGIDCYTVRGRGFYQQQEVLDLIELLVAVADPENSTALAATLRSPLFGVSDSCLLELGLRLHQEGSGARSLADLFAGPHDFDWLTVERDLIERASSVIGELREQRKRLVLPETIELALELTDYESVIAGGWRGPQRVANLRKLVELARHFDSYRFFSFQDFVAYLKQLTEIEPLEAQAQTLTEQDNVVRLMTVHQAKGLEFPVVILADAGRGPNQTAPAPLLDPERGVVTCATTGSGDDEIPNAALAARRAQLKEEENAESARLIYVALTRARDRLIISEGANRQGWAQYLRELVGYESWERFAASAKSSVDVNCDAGRIRLLRPDLHEAVAPPAPAGSLVLDRQQLARVRRRLSRSAPDPESIAITPTALADFERCPRQYWLRHGLGLPEGNVGRATGGHAAARGSVAHAVLEQLRFEVGGRAPELEIRSLTDQFGMLAGLDAGERAAIAHDLTRYIAMQDLGIVIIDRETPFMLNPARWLFIRGQIDVIVERADSTVIVRDYKYTAAAEAEQYRTQLECYALAASHAFPNRPIAVEIVSLRGATQIAALKMPSTEEITAHLIVLGDELRRARVSEDYPQRPTMRSICRQLGCGYIVQCWGD